MQELKRKWLDWSEKFLALSPREQWIISIAAVFLSAYVVLVVLIEPQLESHKKVHIITEQLNRQIESAGLQIEEIKQALKTDPNQLVKEEIKKLEEELYKVESELKLVMTEYIPPKKMAIELTRLLDATPEVKVTGLTVLPAKIIEHESTMKLPSYYQHEFELTMMGDYFGLMSAMKRILMENRQFNVDDVRLEVQKHPISTMRISLMTISDSENVIRL